MLLVSRNSGQVQLRFCLAYIIFFFNDTATTEIYTLSLHDALPIWMDLIRAVDGHVAVALQQHAGALGRSEEHTSELQSHLNLVCRLLLEKKKTEQRRHEQGSDDLSHGPLTHDT